MEFWETPGAAAFLRATRSCQGARCESCPWIHSCQPILDVTSDTGFHTALDFYDTEEPAKLETDAAVEREEAAEVRIPEKLFPEWELPPGNRLHGAASNVSRRDDTEKEDAAETASEEVREPDFFLPAENLASSIPYSPPCKLNFAPPASCIPSAQGSQSDNPNCVSSTPNCLPCEPDCEAELCDILRSIARAENSLTALLDEEGAKLQKAIATACTVAELLQINDSVHTTLARAAALEHTLYLKLETVLHARNTP